VLYLRSISIQSRVFYLLMPLHRINDTTISKHQYFIEVLNEQLIEYLMIRALNAQLLKSFPILGECFPMRLSNPTYFFPYVGNSRGWEILFKENLLHVIPSSNGTGENGEKPCFCCLFKKRGKAFNLTCSSSTPCGFMPTQIM